MAMTSPRYEVRPPTGMNTGQSVWINPTFSAPGTSAPVNTPTTPSTAAATLVSISITSAHACTAGVQHAVEHAVDPQVVDVVLLPHRQLEALVTGPAGADPGDATGCGDSPFASSSTASRIFTYPVQRQRCAPTCRAAVPRSSPAPFLSSNDRGAFTRIPGVQKPHCNTPVDANAAAMRSRWSASMPSSVVTSDPSTRERARLQLTTALPSTSTVQHPH